MRTSIKCFILFFCIFCSDGIASETAIAAPKKSPPGSIRELSLVSEPMPLKARWIPGQDKILMLLNGAIEIVDPESRHRDKLLTMDTPLNLDQQPLTLSPDGTRVVLKETDRTYVFNLRNLESSKIVGPRLEEEDLGGGMIMTMTLHSFGFTWSSDARNIAYYYSKDSWLFDTEKARARRFLSGIKMDSLLFSPTEPMILSYLQGETLYTMHIKEKRTKEISNQVEAYAWFPSGERIALVRNKGLVVVQLENGEETPFSLEMIPNLKNENTLSVSPDGQRIVYVSDKTGGGDIIVYDLNTKTASNITQTEDQSESAPQWSSDGHKILFFRSLDPKNSSLVVPVVLTF
jgi:hypothetical protein